MLKFVCFGEILWDALPTGKVLGGAPLNVAFRLMQLGDSVKMVSGIGADDLGKEIQEVLEGHRFDLSEIQINPKYGTGYVEVAIDERGSATYDILEPVAYDYIAMSETAAAAVADADAFVFGSLACRTGESRATLLKLLPLAKKKIFDVNLRKPHYEFDFIKDMMKNADMIKMNDEELFELCEHFGSTLHSIEQNVKFLAELTDTREICVTKGKFGALFYNDGRFYYNSGFKVKVKDTVGAGDSFLATFLHYYLEGETDPTGALELACAMGALVASESGPNPVISKKRHTDFIAGLAT